ncbi:MAG: hypothetical protein ABSG91_05570, partial [Syntrophobacteraceae bacterium]
MGGLFRFTPSIGIGQIELCGAKFAGIAKWRQASVVGARASFHPERVLFRPRIESGAGSGGVNLRASLCGVPKYASAQPL